MIAAARDALGTLANRPLLIAVTILTSMDEDDLRQIGITEQTFYRWRKTYGGLKLDQAKHFKNLERENARLKKLVADLSLDNAILKEAANPNF